MFEYGTYLLANVNVSNFHLAISLRRSDIDERGVLDRRMIALVRIDVETPDILLLRLIGKQDHVGIHVPISAKRNDSSFDISGAFDEFLVPNTKWL